MNDTSKRYPLIHINPIEEWGRYCSNVLLEQSSIEGFEEDEYGEYDSAKALKQAISDYCEHCQHRLFNESGGGCGNLNFKEVESKQNA